MYVPSRIRLPSLLDGRFTVRLLCTAACAVSGQLSLDARSARRAGITRRARTVSLGNGRNLRRFSANFTLTIRIAPAARKSLRRVRTGTLRLRVTATGGMRRKTLVRSITLTR